MSNRATEEYEMIEQKNEHDTQPSLTTVEKSKGSRLIANLNSNVYHGENIKFSKPATHIMISFEGSKKLGSKLAEELSKLGYRTWQQDTGSSLVGPIKDSTDEDVRAAAVELASHVVVCVSRSYKESQFCRMEANYAQQLCRTDRLQMHWVMLESDYTPISKGSSCNGWLGLMIGDDPWYPGFHDAAICATAVKLASVFGSDGYNNRSATTADCDCEYLSVDDTQLATAYSLLMNSGDSDCNGNHPAVEVRALLDEWGVESADDLRYLSSCHIVDLARCLKIVQRKKFLLAMNETTKKPLL